MYAVIGLGNPGKEYEGTRHNTGRMAVLAFAKTSGANEWVTDKKTQSLKSEVKAGKEKITCLLPETFMNKSGKAVLGLKPNNIILFHDDLDLPLGKFKISFGRGSGGHKGVESVMRALKSRDFVRIRIGISPKKKPDAKKINDFILKKFSPAEIEILKKIFKKTPETIGAIVTGGLQKAMNLYN